MYTTSGLNMQITVSYILLHYNYINFTNDRMHYFGANIFNKMSRSMKKNALCTQRRLRSVWSESSLSAWRNIGMLVTHWVHSED